MALRSEYSLGHSEFNAFLFAFVGEEKNGLELTVLSALTRLGFDPWREAARLSSLPRETAARLLTATIALLPEGDWKTADSGTIAERLVDCLPRRPPPDDQVLPARRTWKNNAASRLPIWLVVSAVIALLLALTYLHSDNTSGPAPSATTSVPRE